LVKAVSGKDALRQLLAREFALILLDVRMPGLDGFETARLIRARERSRLTPIIFLTAEMETDEMVAKGYSLGAVDYLIKPLAPEILRAKVKWFVERERTHDALRQSEQNFRNSLENSIDGMMVVDGGGLVVFANAVATRMFDRPLVPLLGAPIPLPIPAIPGQTTELEIVSSPGKIATVEIRMVPTAWQSEPARLFYIRDISERKQVEAEKGKLQMMSLQLQKSESLGRMAGAIGHHFNNQLQTVMLRLEMATTSLSQNTALVAGLSEAMQAARKAAEVSALMLTYIGKAQVEYEPLDISDVCLESLALLRVAMPPGIVLETDIPSPGPVISADANRIQQVLTNLMTNAWEARGDGLGIIRLTVKTVTAADIPTALRFPINYQVQGKSYACLEVADAGGGIAAKDSDKLFDPFFSTKFVGRGLGLPVVLGIVRSHNGVVTVENEPGRGSTFRVFIPESTEAVRPSPVHMRMAPVSENVRRGTTVLVVEDDEILRDTLALILEFSDYTVLTAEDGVAALESFRQHRDEIGCVVCDLTMPRMNGWETLTALRQLAPDLPVILASGYSEAQMMKGDHPERPQAFLHKPYEAKVLINAVNRVLTNKKE
jgi:CheY-like chemotaxis protein